MSKKRSVGIGASLFTVIGFGVLGFLSLQLREGRVWQSGMSHGYIVKAKFDNVGSLRIGAPVKLAGVRVGRVSAIRLEASTGYKAVVEVILEERFATIPKDSDAAIQTASLLGGNYIAITPGGAATPLVDGNEIHTGNSAFSLERLIGQSMCAQHAGGCVN
jgi:phospholipid/cholesterol/gamma-HCH transport system substrate-binding protein